MKYIYFAQKKYLIFSDIAQNNIAILTNTLGDSILYPRSSLDKIMFHSVKQTGREE